MSMTSTNEEDISDSHSSSGGNGYVEEYTNGHSNRYNRDWNPTYNHELDIYQRQTAEYNRDTEDQIQEPRPASPERVADFDPPARPLNSRDIASFIINKMIGTGIFTTPPTVLSLTRNKGLAFGLWIVGFAYTILSMIIYVEFARVLPHTGGELVYLDAIFDRPKLLFYVIYAFYFILIYNTTTNALQFSNQVLQAANIGVPTYTPDRRLLVFIAIVILSLLCLLHYFSARSGRALNQTMAALKIVLLITIIGAAASKAQSLSKTDNGGSGWSSGAEGTPQTALAFLLILFSFNGWENATFVSGEVSNHQILRRGFIAAILIVGTLYCAVNLAVLFAIPEDMIDTVASYPTYAPWLFGNSESDRLSWSILISLSAAGSILSIIYTCSRVKQTIGKANILPWSRIWEASSPFNNPDPSSNENPTPQGGLILHWIANVAFIFVTLAIPNTTSAIGFAGSVQAYALGWVGVFISVAFPYLNSRYKSIPEPLQRHWNRTNKGKVIKQPRYLQPFVSKLIIAGLYLASNLYIVIALLANKLPSGYVARQWYAVTVLGIISLAITYYFTTIYSPERTVLKAAGVRPDIVDPQVYEPQYGTRRKVVVTVVADRPSLLYMIFGGRNREHWPGVGVWELFDRLFRSRRD